MESEEVSFNVTVPGKLILMGEHSIIYKKLGLAASINKRLIVRFDERPSSDCIELHFKTLNFHKKWSFETVREVILMDKPVLMGKDCFSLGKPELIKHKLFIDLLESALNLEEFNLIESQKFAILGVFYLMTSMLWCVEIDFSPFYIEVESELSVGAGTGSSAAFSVGVASALYQYIKLKSHQKYGTHNPNVSKHEFEPFFVSTSDLSDFTPEDKAIINKWAYSVEKIIHSTPSGLDNTVCTFGKAVQINAKSSGGGGEGLEHLQSIPALRVLLVHSNIRRNTSDMVKRVSNFRELCPIAVDSVLHAMDTVATEFVLLLHALAEAAEEGSVPNLDSVMPIYRQLEGLIDIQHGLLRTLGVSHPRLDEICEITKRRGLHSKLTGAGGGGYAFTLLTPATTRAGIEELEADLRLSGFTVEDVKIFAQGLSLGKV